ncbi:MAG: hypothetical protein Q6353_022715 [Candidatus Sigynarchaeum springense]
MFFVVRMLGKQQAATGLHGTPRPQSFPPARCAGEKQVFINPG